MTPIDWGDIATWLTGIATIALFIVGLVQTRNERTLRVKQENETKITKERSQAEQISCWIEGEDNSDEGKGLWVAVQNLSSQPVYNAIVRGEVMSQIGSSEGGIWGISDIAFIRVLPPSLKYISLKVPYRGMHRFPGVDLAFTDSKGKHWFRTCNGELIEIEESPIEYFKIDLPIAGVALHSNLPKNIQLR